MKVNLSLYCEKTFCLHNIWCAQNKNYATMGVWERMPLRSHSLLLFPPQPRRLPGYIRRTSESAHTSGPEGCALHAAFIPRCAYKLVVVMAHKNLLAVKEPRQCLRAHGYRTRGRRGTDLEADKTRRMFLSGKAQGCLSRLPLQSRPPQSTRG